MDKIVDEQSYIDLVTQVFADVSQLPKIKEVIDGSEINTLKHIFSTGMVPTELELKRLKIVQGVMETFGSDEQRSALKQIIKDHQLLTSITAPQDDAQLIAPSLFQLLQPVKQNSDVFTDVFTLVANDVDGKAVAPQSRNLLFSDADVTLNYSTLTDIRSDDSFLSFLNPSDGQHWTIIRPDALLARGIDKDSILDSRLLPILFLGDMGYFPNTHTLTLYKNIGIDYANRLSDRLLHGFSIVPPGEDEWVPIVTRSTDPNGDVMLYSNPAITEENAGPVLANLIAFAETLKQSGIVLDAISLSKIEADLTNGRLRLPVNAGPAAYDADLFSKALDEQSKGGEIRAEATDGALYTPAFAVYPPKNDHTFKVIEQQNILFLSMIDILATKSGRQQRPLSYIKAWDSLVNLHDFYISREIELAVPIIRKFKETIFKIIQYYIEVLGQDGLDYFTVQLPLQPLKIEKLFLNPQRWFEYAKSIIDKAKKNAGTDMRQYWIDSYNRLLGSGKILPFKKGGGGTPQNPPPAKSGPAGSPPDNPIESTNGYNQISDQIEGADLDDSFINTEGMDPYTNNFVLNGGFAVIGAPYATGMGISAVIRH